MNFLYKTKYDSNISHITVYNWKDDLLQVLEQKSINFLGTRVNGDSIDKITLIEEYLDSMKLHNQTIYGYTFIGDTKYECILKAKDVVWVAIESDCPDELVIW